MFLSVRTLGMARCHIRSVTTFNQIPTNAGKVPPTLEEFDPLNPGEWQLGAGGKILPRLPEGTRVGKLVMGKYGLYDPVLKKRVDTYSKALLDGKKSEEAGPFDRGVTVIVKTLGLLCFVIGIYNLCTLTYGKPLPPYTNLKAPGS
uniref:Succinate dehydrogenase [ubiquinone] cytochrome b small subunit n=1 Tax=Heterorhabditis bacteriophora TaxID=37862 RepID=A0A1I7XM16_HETBA